jgi:zinc protease
VDKTDVNQSNIWIVGLGTKRDNPDYYALSVMNQVFSGGFGSRLFQTIRTKLHLAYSVFGAYGASYDHPGLFYTAASTQSITTEKATKALLDQIFDLKTEPFNDAEVRKAKDELLNSFVFHYDTPEKLLAEQAKLEFYGYPADFLDRYHDAIEKVTPAELERVARKYIDPAKLAVLVVGNTAQYGAPLSDLDLGKVQPLDISIPGAPAGTGPVQ